MVQTKGQWAKASITPVSVTGGGNRVYTNGSGIGTDCSMVVANHRCDEVQRQFASEKIICTRHSLHTATTNNTKTTPTTVTETIPNERRFATNSQNSGMDDEYGEMTNDGDTYEHPTDFVLESGEVLPNGQIKYITYGTLNEPRDNELVVCHALTGNASLHS